MKTPNRLRSPGILKYESMSRTSGPFHSDAKASRKWTVNKREIGGSLKVDVCVKMDGKVSKYRISHFWIVQ